MSSVRVAVRCRPLNQRERDLAAKVVVRMKDNQTFLTNPEKSDDVRTFTFDHSYWSSDKNDPHYASQEQVFNDLGNEVLQNAWQGYNACIFAYGQTGSGKSYSMMGTEEDKGIIPRLCEAIFQRIEANTDPTLTFKVEVSYMEIYNEKVRDLLNPSHVVHNLKVREHPVLGPYVENLSKLLVSSHQEILLLMEEGNKARTVAATAMNALSSRSHAIFNIIFTQIKVDEDVKLRSEKVSKISLVDLAGSERAGKSGTSGDRLKEGANINKSLTTLGLVIKALVERSAAGDRSGKSPVFVPYRDSVLTWLIKDNLGGNSKTIMIATLSPADANYEETLSTLRYADRAKQIVNKAIVNEDENARVIRELKEEIARLREQLGTAGGAAAPAAAAAAALPGADTAEVQLLRDRLAESEKLISEMSMSWEDRRRESERVQAELLRSFRAVGKAVTIEEGGLPHLVNMTEDPRFSDVLLYHLPLGLTRVGSAKDAGQDIVIDAEDMCPAHAVFENNDGEVYVAPAEPLEAEDTIDGQDNEVGDLGLTTESAPAAVLDDDDTQADAEAATTADTADTADTTSDTKADTAANAEQSLPPVYVNGRQVTSRTRLQHGQFVALGRSHLFRFNHPAEAARARQERQTTQSPQLSQFSSGFASFFGAAASPSSSDMLAAVGDAPSSPTRGLAQVHSAPLVSLRRDSSASGTSSGSGTSDDLSDIDDGATASADAILAVDVRDERGESVASALSTRSDAAAAMAAQQQAAALQEQLDELRRQTEAEKQALAEEKEALHRAFEMRVKEIQQQLGRAPPATTIQVLIPNVELATDAKGNQYHVYQVSVQALDDSWVVYRRYKQFAELHARIHRMLPAYIVKYFPKKTFMGSKRADVVEMRRERLQLYLRGVVSVLMQQPFSPLERNPTRENLCVALPFLSPDYELPSENQGRFAQSIRAMSFRG